MPDPGTAYDGSLWVTAASSVALVVGSVGFAIVGGSLAARRVAEGSLELPGTDTLAGVNSSSSSRRSSRPIEKLEKGAAESNIHSAAAAAVKDDESS